MSIPLLGNAIPKRNNRLTQAIGQALIKLFGWRIEGEIPNISKFVAIGAPHTSNWDFFLAMAVIWALDIEVQWLAKHTIFRWPIKGILHSLGGIPVNRSAGHGLVEQSTQIFDDREQLILGITPEGTRRKVKEWKTGFYHIATRAEVPILLVSLDFPNRTLGLGPTMLPSGDLEADMQKIRAHFAQFLGRHAELS